MKISNCFWCRSAIYKAGSVPLLAKLIKLDKEEFLIPIVGLAQECAVEVNYKVNGLYSTLRHLRLELSLVFRLV